MLKIFVFCEDFHYMKKIVNQVLINIEETKIVGITNNLDEAEKLLKDNQADIVISSDPEIINIVKEKFFTYNPYYIIFVHKRKKEKSTSTVLYEYYNSSPKRIITRIYKFINSSIKYSQKERISILLKELGFEFRQIGTSYLLDAIFYVRTYKGSLSFNSLANDLYTRVARENNTTTDIIKWAISRSVNYMYEHHTKSSYKASIGKYLHLEYPEKPTPKQIISIISNKLD